MLNKNGEVMIREKESNKILSENVKNHINTIKGYFEKNASCYNIEKDMDKRRCKRALHQESRVIFVEW